MNTERPPSAEEQPIPRFSQNFWANDAGYSALTTRMRHAKLTCQEILGMFQARAALEEEYGKKLLKLSKSPLGKDELGTLRDSLDVVRFEIEATGKSHIELAGKMRDQLESALAEFNNTQKDMRKLHQASIDRTFRNKQLYLQQLVKAKEKYDTESGRTRGLLAAKMNLVGKELDKVSMKMEKTELASKAAGIFSIFFTKHLPDQNSDQCILLLDVEYQASIRQLTDINDKWVVEWRAACDSCERIRSSLELCDVYQNLQSFIETSATGDEAPDIPTYLNSKNNDGQEIMTSSQPQEARVRTVCGPHQPISSNSSPSSLRRQSLYSADADSATATGPVEIALNIGNNLFKLDLQTAAQINQADEPTTPLGHPTHKSNGERSPSTPVVDPRISVADNVLGISLDASGTVKENRFPHWQSQAPLQSQNQTSSHPSAQYSPGHTAHSPTSSRISAGVPLPQILNQTMPNQNDLAHPYSSGADPNLRRMSAGTSYGGPENVQQQYPSHHHHHGQPGPTSVTQHQSTLRMAPDGRPILFYVRAIYDYEATIPEELSLKEGDILGVLHTRDDGWWEGNLMDDYRGLMRGLFPSNFTEPTA
ncbi:Proline-serine-threonine phosphatase-interacting protein 2 [Entomortierella beljakovae]|nr:Proline-serine-threonine phosphatase-interacting protein 2 [Entomortierella beljakovae]